MYLEWLVVMGIKKLIENVKGNRKWYILCHFFDDGYL